MRQQTETHYELKIGSEKHGGIRWETISRRFKSIQDALLQCEQYAYSEPDSRFEVVECQETVVRAGKIEHCLAD